MITYDEDELEIMENDIVYFIDSKIRLMNDENKNDMLEMIIDSLTSIKEDI
jgi:hypothetical protein